MAEMSVAEPPVLEIGSIVKNMLSAPRAKTQTSWEMGYKNTLYEILDSLITKEGTITLNVLLIS